MTIPKLKLTTQLIIDEATARGLDVEMINPKKSFFVITDTSGKAHYLHSNSSSKTSAINHWIAKNKSLTYSLAKRFNVMVPATENFVDPGSAKVFLSEYKSIVVKPVDAAHGNGVTVDVSDETSLLSAVTVAKKYSSRIILQQQIMGDDYRLLFIGDKLSAASIREPASVVGDGVHSLAELIIVENRNPDRGTNYQKKLNVIDQKAADHYLGDRIHTIPEENERVSVVGTANMGTGGRALDVTDVVDPMIVEAGLRITRGLDMGLCAVDFMVDPSQPEIPWLIEINATPSFGLHEYPSEGKSRNVTKDYLDWLLG